MEEKQEVKVIEITGEKLDPNANYLFVISRFAMKSVMIDRFYSQLRTLGIKATIVLTDIPIHETIKVYSIPKDEPNA